MQGSQQHEERVCTCVWVHAKSLVVAEETTWLPVATNANLLLLP